MGATYTTNFPTKSAIKGMVTIDLNVWGLAQQRKSVSDLANQIFLASLEMRETPNYFISTDIQSSTITLREDNSTNTRLWRGMLSLSINF
ncbi:phage capsid protein [Enterococcus mundtii]|nr:phage capsid protein [Enterococcus mundtii]